jgi:hypothetical protein
MSSDKQPSFQRACFAAQEQRKQLVVGIAHRRKKNELESDKPPLKP